MTIQYVTSINDTDKKKMLLLIDASLQAYCAFNQDDPEKCQQQKIVSPAGFHFVDYWTGVDSLFSRDKHIECYGVIFRSNVAPFTYIFAFRGTSSTWDVLDDLGAESKDFVAHDSQVSIPANVTVESGFFDVYSESTKNTPSMQSQLFQLIDKYQASDKQIAQIYITGHSLGSSLSTLFTLDLALSRPNINASNINFASPRVGNDKFVAFYESQEAQQNANTRTLRVQNTYDKVPCVPPNLLGYEHTSYACLIAFYKDSWIGKLNLLDCHSSNNYSAVLNDAAKSELGVCVCEDLFVPANGYAVTSVVPQESTI